MIGQRLKQLRLVRGLTLEALSAEIGGMVTKQALSKYERDRAKPSARVLNKLAAALGVKAAYLLSEPRTRIEFVAYRKGSGLPKKEQAKVESFVREAFEERLWLQELMLQDPTQEPDGSALPVQRLKVERLEDAEQAARRVRAEWNIGTDPIASMSGLLEDHFVHVIEIEANEKFDGISAVAYGDDMRVVAAAVVSRRSVAGDRQRLNLGHELGHLVLDVSPSVDEEKAAFRFGTALLTPAETLYREIGAKRAYLQLEELMLLKQRFGISIQALLHRLHDLEIITDSHYVQWCKDISRLGWKRVEPLPMPSEQPRWLRRSVLRALSEGLVTVEEASRVLGEQLDMKAPISLVEKRAFAKLPVEERRRILAEQADKMAASYGKDLKWRELQGGDIFEF
jgi:transcriptional regulator with XRE-family HTH domain